MPNVPLPGTIATAIQNAAEAGFEATLETEKQTITNLIYTEDYGEAITAFGEKRTPTFKGR